MKALITAPFAPDQLEALRAKMDVVYESWRDTKEFIFSSSELVEKLAGVDVFVSEGDNITPEVIAGTNLKILGLTRNNPNTIDLESATKAGIPVLFAPHRNLDAVADMTLCLILALCRNLTRLDRHLHSEAFEVVDFEDWVDLFPRFPGMELRDKVVGIVGLGAIGSGVAARLQPFGAKLVAYDPYVPDARATEVGAEKVSLEELMETADVVTVHAPPIDETDGLISEALIRRMKPTALFVNTSKGSLVDEDALLEALQERKIAGAALDVFQVEPLDEDNEFLELAKETDANLIVTPHFGGNTVDVVARQSRMITAGILALLAGRDSDYVLNPEVLGDFSLEGV